MIKCAMIKPPTKNPTTAFSEGNCKLLKPEIACPEVQPPAYREPNPMSIPPMIKIKITFGD